MRGGISSITIGAGVLSGSSAPLRQTAIYVLQPAAAPIIVPPFLIQQQRSRFPNPASSCPSPSLLSCCYGLTPPTGPAQEFVCAAYSNTPPPPPPTHQARRSFYLAFVPVANRFIHTRTRTRARLGSHVRKGVLLFFGGLPPGCP